MSFWDDFGSGFSKPFVRIYGLADKVFGATENIVDGVGGAAGFLGDLFSGNTHIMLYLGLGLIAVVALPTVLNKIL